MGFVPDVDDTGGPSEELAAFYSLGLVSLEAGTEPLLILELDARKTGTELDLRPQLPLCLRW